MRLPIIVLCFAVLTPSVRGDEPSAWKEFVAKEGQFKVLMPGTPKQDTLATDSDFGKGELHMNSVEANKTIYAANYCDFPAGIKNVALKQVYDSSRNGAVANMSGKLSSEKDIKLGEHSGREIRVEVGEGKRLFRARVYLVEQRLFQVVVFGKPEAVTSKEADKFLDSFQLTEMGGVEPAKQTSPVTQPPTSPKTTALPARDAAVLEAALRDQLRSAGKDKTIFISVGSIHNGWKDPPLDFVKRLNDLPYAFKPVSQARMPKKGEMESPNRFRGVEDPTTGKPAWIYWAEIKEWVSESKVRVNVGVWSGPLGGGGSLKVFEFRDGKWVPTGTEGGWVS